MDDECAERYRGVMASGLMFWPVVKTNKNLEDCCEAVLLTVQNDRGLKTLKIAYE